MKTSKAEVVREYGPFPGTEQVGGVSFDGKHVWFASTNGLNSFYPETGRRLATLDVAGRGLGRRLALVAPSSRKEDPSDRPGDRSDPSHHRFQPFRHRRDVGRWRA